MPNAMSIDQDGNDYTYFCTMELGSKGQKMYMLIDSGSANTWVMGSNCKSNACQLHNTYGEEDSATLQTTTQSWSMTYGTGQVEGVVVTDTVRLANYTVNMGFGLATTASDDFNNYPMDGILGLGQPSSDALGTPTIMQVLDDQAKLPTNIVGIHLQRGSDGLKDGQITFGSVDSSKFSGKLAYSKTVNDQSWKIVADDAGVDGNDVGFSGKSAIIDTGTSYVLMPPTDAAALHALIPKSSHNGEVYVVPCDTSSDLYFTFSGTKYSVSPKDYVGRQSGDACQSNIIGHQAFGPDDWILGDVFLKNVYTVLDFDDKRIGFGTHSGAASQYNNNTSSTTMTTSNPPSTTKPPTSSSLDVRTSTTFATSTTGNSSTDTSATAAATSTEGGDSSPFGMTTNDSSSNGARDTRSSLSSVVFLVSLIGFFV